MTPFLLALLLTCNLDSPPVFDAQAYDRLVAADLDRDGEVDLVSDAGSTVTVTYGTAGDGFEPPRAVQPTNGIHALAVADLDGDGLPDIIVTAATEGQSRAALVLRNRGGRTFAEPVLALRDALAMTVAIDVDADGDLDLVAQAEANALVSAINDGRGNFTPGPMSPTERYVHTILPGDFDGNGRVDLLAIDFSDAPVRVFRGHGTGLFTFQQNVDAPLGTLAAATGELNGDRFDDIVLVDRANNRVRVYFGSSGRLVESADRYVCATPTVPLLEDVDGDGDRDLVVLASPVIAGCVFLNDGHGNLAPASELPGGLAGLGAAFGDTNRDGLPDLILYGGSSRGLVAVARNRGGGRFRGPQTIAIGSAGTARVADIDGDGAGDLLTIGNNPTIVTIDYNDGNGAFVRSEQVGLPEGSTVVFPVDGRLVAGARDRLTVLERRDGRWVETIAIAGNGFLRDAAAADARHLAVAWLQERVNVLEMYVLALPDVPRWRAEVAPSLFVDILVRDFTGDGVNDLLVTGSGTLPGIPHDFTPMANGYLSLFTGRGDGTFGDERRILSNASFLPAAAGDFDGDGDPDVVIGAQRGGDLIVLRNDGRGGFGAPEIVERDAERNGIRYAAGDVNGDGVDDLVTSFDSSALILRFGTPAGFVARPPVLGRGFDVAIERMRRGALPVVTFGGLTTFELACEAGRRRAS